MPAWLAAPAKWALDFVLRALDAALKWIGYLFAYRLGQRRERQRQAEEAARVKDEQLRDAARPDRHRSELLERMYDRDL